MRNRSLLSSGVCDAVSRSTPNSKRGINQGENRKVQESHKSTDKTIEKSLIRTQTVMCQYFLDNEKGEPKQDIGVPQG